MIAVASSCSCSVRVCHHSSNSFVNSISPMRIPFKEYYCIPPKEFKLSGGYFRRKGKEERTTMKIPILGSVIAKLSLDTRHHGRRNRFSSRRYSPLPFDLQCHRLPGLAGLFPGEDGRRVQGGMGRLGDPVRARAPKTRKTADSCGRDLPFRNPSKRPIGLKTPDQRPGRGQVQDRFGHKGPDDRGPFVRRTPGSPPALSDLIPGPDNLQNGHDLPVLFRQRSQAILDPGKQGSLNAFPDRGKFLRTSWG